MLMDQTLIPLTIGNRDFSHKRALPFQGLRQARLPAYRGAAQLMAGVLSCRRRGEALNIQAQPPPLLREFWQVPITESHLILRY